MDYSHDSVGWARTGARAVKLQTSGDCRPAPGWQRPVTPGIIGTVTRTS